jgi:hypothetical protein
MSRFPRFVQESSMQVITVRTLGGRHLFRPVPALTKGVLGVLGRALELFPVQLHAFVYLSNHAHLLLTIARAWMMAAFLHHVNKGTGDVARAINGPVGPVWGRAHNAVVLDNGGAISQLQYLLANSVKEGLVDDPREWPGPSSASALLDGTPLRARWKRVESGIEEDASIPLTPLPCLADLPPDERRSRTQVLADNAIALARKARGDLPALGIAGILAQDPYATHKLKTRKRAPIAHAARTQLALDHRDERIAWINAFRLASSEFRETAPVPTFPADAFPPAPRGGDGR